MVMEASPTSSLKVPEPELLFEFLVVPLDAPAQLRERDEAVEGDVFRKGRKPELIPASISVLRRACQIRNFLPSGRLASPVIAFQGNCATWSGNPAPRAAMPMPSRR